ncbi:MAG: hypothetical protein Q9165_007701 [Trypethelium subeluteriae]
MRRTPVRLLVVVPSQVLQLIDPAWSTCSGDFRGLYDPPYALHGAAAAATPTPSDIVPSTVPIIPAPAPWIQSLPTHTPSPARPFASPNHEDVTTVRPLVGNDQTPAASPLPDGDPSLGHDPSHRGSTLTGKSSRSIVPSDAESIGESAGEGFSGNPSSNDRGSSPSPGDPSQGDSDNGSVAKGSADNESGDNRLSIKNSKSQYGRPASGASTHSPPIPVSSWDNPSWAVVSAAAPGEGRDPPGYGDSNVKSIVGSEVVAIIGKASDGHVHRQSGQSSDPARNDEGIPHRTAFDPVGDETDSGNFAQKGLILSIIEGQTIHRDPKDPGAVSIASSTLLAGGPAMTVAGRVISMASSGLVVDGTTRQFSRIPDVTPALTDFKASFTILGKTYSVYEDPKHPELAVLVGTSGVEITRLRLGGAVATISGLRISLNSIGIKVGSTEVPLHIASVHEKQGFFADGTGHIHTVVMESAANVAILDGSITLTRGGPPLTIDGDFVTWASDGLFVDNTQVIFDSTTATAWQISAPQTTDMVDRPSMLGVVSSPLPSETKAQAANQSRSKMVLAFDSIPLLALSSLVLALMYFS